MNVLFLILFIVLLVNLDKVNVFIKEIGINSYLHEKGLLTGHELGDPITMILVVILLPVFLVSIGVIFFFLNRLCVAFFLFIFNKK